LRDTRTPLRFALVRVALTTALGYLCALPLPKLLGVEQRWGAVGLTVSAGIAGWVEFTLLRSALNRRIGATGLPAPLVAKLWMAAAAAAAVAWALKLAELPIGARHPTVFGAFLICAYGAVYFGATWLFRVEECAVAIRAITRRFGISNR
jgi:putative peptidoglycan lipid II flippase